MVWGGRQKNEYPQLDPDQPPLSRSRLPSKLQQIVDSDDDFYDDLYSS